MLVAGGRGLIIKTQALTRCQKSPSPRSSFPHRDPIGRRSNSSRRSSTEGQAAAGGARGQWLRGLTMVDASAGTVPPPPGTPATPAGGRQQPRPWRPQPLPRLTPDRGNRGAGTVDEEVEGHGLRWLSGELPLQALGRSAAGG